MILTDKVTRFKNKIYEGEDARTWVDRMMVRLQFIEEHKLHAFFLILLAFPLYCSMGSVYDFIREFRYQSILGDVLILLEIVKLVTGKKSGFWTVINFPIFALNTAILHPIATYGYIFSIPLDLIRNAYVFLTHRQIRSTAVANVNDNQEAKYGRIINAHFK